MKKAVALLLALLLLLAAGCVAPAEVPETPPEEPAVTEPEAPAEPEKEKYAVLFIGNSATARNYMSKEIFKKFARAAGYDVSVTLISESGYTLDKFADPADEFGNMVDIALRGSKKYDFVVLQEQTLRPAGENVDKFYAAVRSLTERIRKNGATPVLYVTPPRKEGSADLTANGWTADSMAWRVAAAYAAIGEELEIPVAHAGLAFRDICVHAPEIELYDADLAHPSYTGSYLVAVTLCAKMFGVDPTAVDYSVRIPDAEAPVLKEAARKAVFETPAIPEEYITSSADAG